MKNSFYEFYLNGFLVTNPAESQEIQVLSTFDNDSPQDNVSVSEVRFALDSARLIRQWVAAGMNGGVGIFEGTPFDITVMENGEYITVGNFMLDFTNYTENEDGSVNVAFTYSDGLASISDRLQAITFSWLASRGLVTEADYVDVPYAYIEVDSRWAIVSTIITIAIMTKALADAVEQAADATAKVTALLATGLAGPVASSIYAIARAIISIAYLAAVLLAYSVMIRQLINYLVPVRRTHKAMRLSTMLEIVGRYLGYTIDTNLPLDRYVYLPSNVGAVNPSGNLSPVDIVNGYPRSGDYGYVLSEAVELMKSLFNAKFAIRDNTLYFRSKIDAFWFDNSEYNLPDILIENVRYNVDELKANTLYSFTTDMSDEWTIVDFTGNNVEVIVSPITVLNPSHVLVKGLEQVTWQVALGSIKTGRSPFEFILNGLLEAANTFSAAFGGGRITTSFSTEGCLKLSSVYHTVPKLLYTESTGRDIVLPEQRNFLSAKLLYENYHYEKSFVSGIGQRKKYSVRVPFGFNDWRNISNNSYFRFDGKPAKIIELRWSVMADYAEIDFWVAEKYSNNLQENIIEA